MTADAVRRVVVGITGASGAIYGIRMLQLLAARPDVESHVVVSRAGALTIQQETEWDVPAVLALADVVHSPGNVGATIASGSFPAFGMVVAPCSIRTLSAIANSQADSLLTRAADVMLKEGRPLVLMVRETPLHRGHLRLLSLAAEAGAIIAPPMPAFYQQPKSIDDLVNHSVVRVLDRLGLPDSGTRPWQGLSPRAAAADDELVVSTDDGMPGRTQAVEPK